MKDSFHVEDGKEFIAHADDLAPHLAYAHEKRGASVRSERIGEFHHAMRIPSVIMLDIMNKTGLDFFNKDDWQEIWKILKSPEYAAFRTTPHSL